MTTEEGVHETSPHKIGVSMSVPQFEALLEANASEELPAGARVTNATRIPGGYNNTTYRVECVWPSDNETATRRIIAVRISKLSSWPMHKLRGEVATIRYVQHHARLAGPDSPLNKVPKVLFFSDAMPGVTDGLAALGMAWAEGETVDAGRYAAMSPAAQQRFVGDAVDFLAALQRLPTPAGANDVRVGRVMPGPSGADGDIVLSEFFDFGCNVSWPHRGPFSDVGEYWREFLRMRLVQLAELRDRLVPLEATEDDRSALGQAFEDLMGLASAIAAVTQHHTNDVARSSRVAVTHYDFCGRNLLVDHATGAINAVVDWEWGAVLNASHDWFEGFDDVGEECRRAIREVAAARGVLPGDGVFWFARADDSEKESDPDAANKYPPGVSYNRERMADLFRSKSDSDDGARRLRGETVAYWLFRVCDELFPWTLSAHMSDPVAFPFPEEGPLRVVSGLVRQCRAVFDSLPVELRVE